MVSTGRERSLANLRPFQKGQSGNVQGRRKQLDHLVASHTHKGADIVAFMADVFYAKGQFEHARVPLAMRVEAATWLADRLWGKPKQVQEVTGKDGGAIEFTLGEARDRLTSRIAELASLVGARLLPAETDADSEGGAAA